MGKRALEIDEELKAVAWAENNGWEVRKMQYVGRRGAPDRFFFGYGAIVPVEFKRLKCGIKSDLSDIQKREHAKLKKVGVNVKVFYESEDCILYLKQYM